MMALEVHHDSGVCTDKKNQCPTFCLLTSTQHQGAGTLLMENAVHPCLLAKKAEVAAVQPLPPFLLPVSSCRHTCSVAQLCLTLATLRTVAHQVPLSMGFPRQGCWSRLLFSTPGNLPNPGTEPVSPALQVDFLLLYHLGSPPACTGLSASKWIWQPCCK